MPFLGTISSPDNARVKYLRSLKNKRRARYREKRYLLEGFRVVSHALQEGHRLVFVFHTEDFTATEYGRRLIQGLAQAEIAVWRVARAVMKTVSDTVTSQGILAVASMGEVEPTAAAHVALVLILDSIRDPGSVGTILRTAQATGVGAVILSSGCADPYSPKAVRAGAGAHLALPTLPDMPWSKIAELVGEKQPVLADPRGEITPWEMDWTSPTALIVGNEAHGAGPEARVLARHRVRLPMSGGVESLNVAIAAAVILFEAQRQRLAGSHVAKLG